MDLRALQRLSGVELYSSNLPNLKITIRAFLTVNFYFNQGSLIQGNLIQGKAQLALKNWKNLFGDQREDSLTSLEV